MAISSFLVAATCLRTYAIRWCYLGTVAGRFPSEPLKVQTDSFASGARTIEFEQSVSSTCPTPTPLSSTARWNVAS